MMSDIGFINISSQSIIAIFSFVPYYINLYAFKIKLKTIFLVKIEFSGLKIVMGDENESNAI
jgi:hypothetical protein